jgi:hypothetical protein
MDASYDVVVGLGASLDAVSGTLKFFRVYERGLGDEEGEVRIYGVARKGDDKMCCFWIRGGVGVYFTNESWLDLSKSLLVR